MAIALLRGAVFQSCELYLLTVGGRRVLLVVAVAWEGGRRERRRETHLRHLSSHLPAAVG